MRADTGSTMPTRSVPPAPPGAIAATSRLDFGRHSGVPFGGTGNIGPSKSLTFCIPRRLAATPSPPLRLVNSHTAVLAPSVRSLGQTADGVSGILWCLQCPLSSLSSRIGANFEGAGGTLHESASLYCGIIDEGMISDAQTLRNARRA